MRDHRFREKAVSLAGNKTLCAKAPRKGLRWYSGPGHDTEDLCRFVAKRLGVEPCRVCVVAGTYTATSVTVEVV